MGLFDRWKRKSKRKKTVPQSIREREITKPKSVTPEKTSESGSVLKSTPEIQVEIDSLIAEYEQLSMRREELQIERGELTNRLDRGDLTAIEFRKTLMQKIQEAAQVSESIKDMSSKLISLGYRGMIH